MKIINQYKIFYYLLVIFALMECNITIALDLISPTINAGADITVEATALLTPIGDVPLPNPTVTDDFDSNPIVSNDAPSTFPLGITVVTYTATDYSGNSATDSIFVTLEDTTAPTIIMSPTVVTLEATAPFTPVEIPEPLVTDLVDLSPIVTDNIPDPSNFNVGIHTITFTATDFLGNSVVANFTVKITDTTPPVISDPGNIYKILEGSFVPVAIPSTNVADLVDSDPSLQIKVYLPNETMSFFDRVIPLPRTINFPLGATNVAYIAKDSAQNESHITIVVYVDDKKFSNNEIGIIGSRTQGQLFSAVRSASSSISDVENSVRDIAVSPDNSRVYSIHSNGDLKVFRISGTPANPIPVLTRLATLTLLGLPNSIAISKDASLAFISDDNRIIATNLVKITNYNGTDPSEDFERFEWTKKLSAGSNFTQLEVGPSGKFLYFISDNKLSSSDSFNNDTTFGYFGAFSIDFL